MCEKHVFSASVEQNERSQILVRNSTPQRDNLFCFLFSGTIIVGLTCFGLGLGFISIFSGFGETKYPGEQKTSFLICLVLWLGTREVSVISASRIVPWGLSGLSHYSPYVAVGQARTVLGLAGLKSFQPLGMLGTSEDSALSPESKGNFW